MTATTTTPEAQAIAQIDAWIAQLAKAHKAPGTMSSYRSDLLHFHRHVAPDVGAEHFVAVRPDHVADYITNAKLSSATKSRRYTSLNAFFEYLKQAGLVDGNPVSLVARPTTPTMNREGVASPADVRLIVERAAEGGRDRAILELVAAGMTPAEVAALGIRDVDLAEGTVTARGRAGHARAIPLPVPAIESLRAYLATERSRYHHRDSHHVFLGERGAALDRQTVWKIVSTHSKKTMNPNDMRRSRLAAMHAQGCPDKEIQIVAGHLDIGATRRYRALTGRTASA